jgi:hypothetical protein
LVYRAGYPTVGSFYDVFPMNANYEDVIVEVTGTFADYVSIVHKTSKGS